MKKFEYKKPVMEELKIVLPRVIAASNLENPTEGEEWGWN